MPQPSTVAATPTLSMAEEGIAGAGRAEQQAAVRSTTENDRVILERHHSPRMRRVVLQAMKKLSRVQAESPQNARRDDAPTNSNPAGANTATGAVPREGSTRDDADVEDGAGGQARPSERRHFQEETRPTASQSGTSNQPRYTSSDVDYEQKYAPDPYGEELGTNARVWSVYNDEAQMADKERVQQLNGTLDVLLAGLFSAVVTTFVAQSSQALNPDYAQITASLVYELVLMQRAINSGNPGEVPRSPLSLESRTHQTSDLWVNGLWLASLTFSLLTALVSVLAKQWIQHFDSVAAGGPRDRAIVRQFRLLGLERWRVFAIIASLPALLTIALFFFFAGLAVYVAPLDTTLYIVVISLSGASVLAYAASITLPMIYPQCAYRTPVSDYIWAIIGPGVIVVIFLCCVLLQTLGLVWGDDSFGCFALTFVIKFVQRRLLLSAGARESSLLRRSQLMMDALEWLATSSFNDSAASISAQAASALDLCTAEELKKFLDVHGYQRVALLQTSLHDCGTSIAQVMPLAGRIERLMRNSWKDFWAPSYAETTRRWLNEHWNSLHNCHDENILPLRMLIYAAALEENQVYQLLDHTVLQRAVCAVDHETWPSGLLLHPGVWRHLCYAMRQYENVARGVSALKPYAEPSPSHEDDGYGFLGRDYYEKTAISLDAYAQRCQAGTGRDDILSCMDALRRFFLERLAELESDTAKADRDGTEDDGAQGSSQRGEVEAQSGLGTVNRSAREFAAASGGEPERHIENDENALAAGRANDPSHPSGENAENVEMPVQPGGAAAAMSARVDGTGIECEVFDTGLHAAAPPAAQRMPVGEGLRKGDATSDEPSKAVVGSAQGAEDGASRVEEGVRSVGRPRGSDDGERADEQETDVVVHEGGTKADDRHGKARLDTGAAVRFEPSAASASLHASMVPATGSAAEESEVGFDGVVASNVVSPIAPPSVGEVEPPSTSEGPTSTGGRKPRLARRVESPPGEIESLPSEVRSSLSEGERRNLSDNVDRLPDGAIRPLDVSHNQPSAGKGSGPSNGGQAGEL